jgi:hypothetical protein
MKHTFTKALLLGCLFPLSANANWFSNSNALTLAHKALLEDDLGGMLDSLITSWQQEPLDADYRQHVNDLLESSLQIDCGKSISTRNYPEWLKSLNVTQISTERPGRVSYALNLSVDSSVSLTEVRLSDWPDTAISKETKQNLSFDNESGAYHLDKEFMLNQRLAPGLYRLELSTELETWTDWLIIYDELREHELHWSSKETWKVMKNDLLNPHCPIPVQEVKLLDYVDGEYQAIYDKSYEGKYSERINAPKTSNDRYVLQVSLSHYRYQGMIRYVDQQIISKTIDFTED